MFTDYTHLHTQEARLRECENDKRNDGIEHNTIYTVLSAAAWSDNLSEWLRSQT